MPPLSDSDNIAFINEMKKHPVLWDVMHKNYYDRFCSAVAWKNVARKLNTEEQILKARWKGLRDIFKRELKKYSHPTQEYRGRWKFFHSMSFLKENYFIDEEYGKVKDDGYPIEFIIENDSGSDEDDNCSETSSNNHGDNSTLIEYKIHNKRLKTSDSTKEASLDGGNETEDTFKEYNNINYTSEINTEDNVSVDSIPVKRKRTESMNNDVMFLKSLAPYFKLLEPTRKLVMRSRIQDMLLKEIAEQDSCELTRPPS